MLRQFERYLIGKDWQQVQEGVEVKLVAAPEGDEVFILARSTDRRQKEHAMHQRFIDRMEVDLQKMQRSAASGCLKDIQLAHRRLGRIQQRYWRASSAFDVKIVTTKNPTDKARLKITFKPNKQWSDWAQLSEGYYLLRTNLTNIDPKTLWKRYIQLTEAEWAFRITKDELVIRPIWHQKADRVKAHILVCFLAYVLWKSLAQWMRQAGLGDAPRTLLEEFAKIKSGDVVLPTRTRDNQPKKTVRLRCVTTPDEAQKVLLNRLGLTLPQRLRRIDEVAQM
jgi:transposase